MIGNCSLHYEILKQHGRHRQLLAITEPGSQAESGRGAMAAVSLRAPGDTVASGVAVTGEGVPGSNNCKNDNVCCRL